MRKPIVRAGRQILDIVTSGMYNEPLMIYREYVQNAADSIDSAISTGLLGQGKGRITIDVDGKERRVTIEDNGRGMIFSDARERLCSIGISSKDQIQHRGFRGIGRLGGLAYCENLTFETRASQDEPVTIVRWDGKALQNALRAEDAEDDVVAAINACVSVRTEKRLEEPCHFFRVRMEGVNSFHCDDLMTLTAIREYISKVAPVPFSSELFSPAEEVLQHLREVPGYRTYNISVNGEPVFRPHQDDIEVTAKQIDRINGVKTFIISFEGREIGRGWLGETSLLGAIPPRIAMRGLRVLQGNIQIGDEKFFIDHFLEPRFASWYIGEVHLSYSVKANARRDGFEHTKEYEAVLGWASAVAGRLSKQCRDFSKARGEGIRVSTNQHQLETLKKMPFIIDESHREEVSSLAMDLAKSGDNAQTIPGFIDSIPSLHDALNGQRLSRRDTKDIIVQLAKDIRKHFGDSHETWETLQEIMAPYLKKTVAHK